MRKVSAILLIFVCIFCFSSVYANNTSVATQNTDEIITNETKSTLVKMKDTELKSIEDYKEAYGNATYGVIAYILNKIRIYSIPFGLLGIAISAIYEYVIGLRHMESRDKGFGAMVTIITLFVICQVLPLVFAIIVKGWRG